LALFTKAGHTLNAESYNAKVEAWKVDARAAGLRRHLLEQDETALAEAQAALAAGEAQPSDESGKLVDLTPLRAAVEEAQSRVRRRQRDLGAAEQKLEAALAEKEGAASAVHLDEFKVALKDLVTKLAATVTANERVLKLETRDTGHYAIDLINSDFLANFEAIVERTVNPPPKREINPLELVKILHPTSNVNGPRDGRLFNPGEGAAFPSEVAAILVALGSAEYMLPHDEQPAMIAGARRTLAAREAPRDRGAAQVDVGWK
jgi:hypothetical protein